MAKYDGNQFESQCIKKLVEMVESGEYFSSHSKFSKHVFGENESSPTKWRAIRNQGQSIRISELVDAIQSFGCKPASFMFEVQEILASQPRQKNSIAV